MVRQIARDPGPSDAGQGLLGCRRSWRALFACAVALSCGMGCPGSNPTLRGVQPGLTETEVVRLAGPPTQVVPDLEAAGLTCSCTGEANRALIYRRRSDLTVFVYFDREGRVACKSIFHELVHR